MSIAQAVLSEWDVEMEATRRVLERVPDDKLGWKPHEKSMPLGRLASHVAELPGWAVVTLAQDELDIAPPGQPAWEPTIKGSRKEILELFDQSNAQGRATVDRTTDATFAETWSFKRAGEVLFAAPKDGVLRRFVLNHMIHHRGQLTVFLRLVGVKVPQTFGPTADEPM